MRMDGGGFEGLALRLCSVPEALRTSVVAAISLFTRVISAMHACNDSTVGCGGAAGLCGGGGFALGRKTLAGPLPGSG